jgi:predicted GIY-YIG superfamily endonuclease
VPVIITQLPQQEEAFQFVVINTKQKRVPPDLTLRVLARKYHEYADAVETILGERMKWQIAAQEITEALSSDPYSPWNEAIAPPQSRARQKYICSERAFVSSLHPLFKKPPLCEKRSSHKKDFLVAYWKALAKKFPEAFAQQTRAQYLAQKTLGINSFHGLANLIYILATRKGSPTDKDTVSAVLESCKLNTEFWDRRRGEVRGYGGKKGAAMVQDLILKELIKGYKLNDSISPEQGSEAARLLDRAKRIGRPSNYYPLTISCVSAQVNKGACGAYVLLSAGANSFYVGRAEKRDLQARLLEHANSKKYHLFGAELSRTPEEAVRLEFALWHLFRKCNLDNKEHPKKYKNADCPFCGIDNV